MKNKKTLENKVSGWSRFKSGIYNYIAIPAFSALLGLLPIASSCENNDIKSKNENNEHNAKKKNIKKIRVSSELIESRTGDPWGGKGNVMVYSGDGEVYKTNDEGTELKKIVEKDERDIREKANYISPSTANLNGKDYIIFLRKSYAQHPAMPDFQWFQVPVEGGEKEPITSVEEGLSDVYYTGSGDMVGLRLGRQNPVMFRNLPVEFSSRAGANPRANPSGTKLTTEQYSKSGREIYIQNLEERTDENGDGVLNASKPELLVKGYHGFWWINDNLGVASYGKATPEESSGGIALLYIDNQNKAKGIGRDDLGAMSGRLQVDEEGDIHYKIRINGAEHFVTQNLKDIFGDKLDYSSKGEQNEYQK